MTSTTEVWVCLSGGLDSAVLCGLAKSRLKGCIFVDYGQPSLIPERVSAAKIADKYEVPLITVTVTKLDIGSMSGGQGACVVEARNAIILSCAANIAPRGASLWIGCNKADQQDYFDCTQEFLGLMSKALQRRIEAPLILWSRKHIMDNAEQMGLAGMTWSCYRGGHQPCGQCNSCQQTV